MTDQDETIETIKPLTTLTYGGALTVEEADLLARWSAAAPRGLRGASGPATAEQVLEVDREADPAGWVVLRMALHEARHWERS